MTDFSVNKSSVSKDIKYSKSKQTEFSKLKAEYDAMKKKIAKSDFSNAPVVIRSELNMLSELKRIAQRDGLEQDFAWIEKRETEIKDLLSTGKSDAFLNTYYTPIVSFGKREKSETSEQTELYDELMQLCKRKDGSFDENAEKMLLALSKQNVDLLHVVDILKRAKTQNDEINPTYTKAIVKIADAGVSNADMYTYIDAFTHTDDNLTYKIDLENLDVALSLKKTGMYDDGAVKLAQYLNGNFADKSQVKSSIIKLHKVGVSPDTIQKIISSLAVEDVVTGQKTVSNKSVNTVANLKKLLFSSRKNETEERQSPINQLGVMILELGFKTIMMKDGVVTYASPIQGENYETAKKQYEAMLTSLEDMTLVDFVSRYKDKDGEIDSKYLRIASVLRNSGIVYNQVLDMIDSCIDDDGNMNSDKVSSIVSLKKAGALSDDIMGILEACSKTDDGKYSKVDIANACDLSSAVIAGNEVCSLLPEVRNNDEVKEFVLYGSQFFIDKACLLKLIELAKNGHAEPESNALEVMSSLQENLIKEISFASDEQFLKDTEEIISLARGKDGVLSDDAAGICAILSQNGESAENIKSALTLCTNQDKVVDAKLAEVLWRMGVQNASFDEIEKLINVCKNQEGLVNTSNADMILSLFDSGYSKDKILSLFNK